MLSSNEARAWAEIERRLVREDGAGSRPLHRLTRSVAARTVVPLVLAALFAVLDAPVPALSFLFLVPCGLVVHMARTTPPHATSDIAGRQGAVTAPCQHCGTWDARSSMVR